MKYIKYYLMMVFFVSSFMHLSAQEESWQTVSIPGICTYQIPPTMEIMKGLYKKINNTFLEKTLQIDSSKNCIIAQQKGINSFNKQAMKHYCRVIINIFKGEPGDYEPFDSNMSQAELQEFNATIKQYMEKSLTRLNSKGIKTIIHSWLPAKIIKIDGTNAIQITYTRSTNKNPSVLVKMYMIPKNDYMMRVTISYRIAEKKLWAKDLDTVINTFKFKKTLTEQ